MAIVLALATTVVAVVDAGKGDAASHNVTLICQSTPYPDACETALTSRVARSAGDPFVGSIEFTISKATSALAQARSLSTSPVGTVPQQSGLHDCAMLLEITVHQLRDALAGSVSDAAGATTWLSSALTNQDTCNDSLTGVPPSAGRSALRRQVGALAMSTSTALALHVGNFKSRWSGVAPAPAPKLGTMTAFPPWVSEHDRWLLESRASDIKPDAVVAQDGSGTHRTIGEAITAVADRAGRKVIYVKSGRYEERVTITYMQENVMLVGDGKGRTIVDSKNSVAGGYDTISTATVGTLIALSSIYLIMHECTGVVSHHKLWPYNDYLWFTQCYSTV
jgi:pectinesterase inhibitor-like protein